MKEEVAVLRISKLAMTESEMITHVANDSERETVVRVAMPHCLAETAFRRIELSGSAGLFFETKAGERIMVDRDEGDRAAVGDKRPVVYLDQRDWSEVAKAMQGPTAADDSPRRVAARRIAKLARDRSIILPFSNGHLIETMQWKDQEKRLNHALTLTKLSHGWQMRDPRTVWEAELMLALMSSQERGSCRVPKVITTEPFAASKEMSERWPDVGPIGSFASHFDQMQAFFGWYDALLDKDHVEREGHPEWVRKQLKIMELLDFRAFPEKQQRRSFLSMLSFTESSKNVLNAAITAGTKPSEMEVLFNNWDTQYPRLPALGLFTEAYIQRHLGVKKWNSNDYIDLIYLSAAASYSDVVIAEGQATAMIAQAQRKLDPDCKVNIFSSMQAGLQKIELLIADRANQSAGG